MIFKTTMRSAVDTTNLASMWYNAKQNINQLPTENIRAICNIGPSIYYTRTVFKNYKYYNVSEIIVITNILKPS